MKIIVFSTGSRCEYLLKLNKDIFNLIDVVAFVDNDINKVGRVFHEKKIIAPSEIEHYEYDYIYVANIDYYDEIYTQLTDSLGIPSSKVKKEDFLQRWFAEKEYALHYVRFEEKNTEKKNNTTNIDNCKIVVYTAIFGDFDMLKSPEYIDSDMDYICFTDNKNIQSDVWDITYVSPPYLHKNPRMNAKIYKILPHVFLNNYDISVWIDGTVVIRGNIREYIKKYMKYTNTLFCPHPCRNDVYDEAEYSINSRAFEDISAMQKQIGKYRAENIPRNNGMVAAGVIVRKHNELDVINIMNAWWKEICDYSTQDQISFAYIAWKNSFLYDISAEYIYDNDYIYLTGHK